MNVLVTGGAGFLGREIVRQLRADGHAVAVFQRSAAPDLEAAGVEVRRGRLDDAAAVAAACAGRDAVFHTAAKAGVWGPRAEYEAANVAGTRAVVAGCQAAGVPHLIYTSTPSVVFCGQDFRGADESQPYGRDWLCDYAETKARAEQALLAAHAPGRLEVAALRPHLIYGPGDPHLLPRLLAKARAGRLAQVGDGANEVDLTDVRNAAHAHLCAWRALRAGRGGGQAYFVSDGAPVRLWDWIGRVLAELGLPPVRRRLSPGAARLAGGVAEGLWRLLRLPGEPPVTRFVAVELAKSHWFSIAAARRELGYAPVVGPEQAFADLTAHWRAGLAEPSSAAGV